MHLILAIAVVVVVVVDTMAVVAAMYRPAAVVQAGIPIQVHHKNQIFQATDLGMVP